MSFRIKRTTLSPDCRDSIKVLFERKRMKVDLDRLFKAIEENLRLSDSLHKTGRRVAHVKAKYRRQQIRALVKALNGLSPDTKDFLQTRYRIAYAMPPQDVPDKEMDIRKFYEMWVLNQTAKTQLVRMDDRIGVAVELYELTARLLRTCEEAEKYFHPRKGAPVDELRVLFAACMVYAYELFTRTKATSTPAAAFDQFLGYVLLDGAGETDGASRRKLITAARAYLRSIDMDKRVAAWKLFCRAWGNERASRFVQHLAFPEHPFDPDLGH